MRLTRSRPGWCPMTRAASAHDARSCVPWQAGQDHVFSFYDELSPEEQRDLDDQFDRINAQDRISVGTALEFLSAGI